MKECIKCKAQLEDDELFCHECGTRQEIEEVNAQVEEVQESGGKKCIHCGETIEDDSMFCPFCGKPQDVKDVKDEEPESSEQTEQPKQPKPSEQPQEKETYEGEEKEKSKTWLWLLLAILITGGAWYYLLSGSDSDSYPAVEGDYIEEPTDSVAVESTGTAPDVAKEFIESMYKDLYEPFELYDERRYEKTLLSKYFTKEAMQKFYVESDYEEGDFFYCTDFLVNGSISGTASPDYGDKVVSRTIEPEDNDWFLVTNIWDVIKKPVKVHLQVKSFDGTYKVVDVSTSNDNEETYSKQEVQSMKAFIEAFYDKMDIMGVIDETLIENNVTDKVRILLKEKGNDLLTQDEEHCGEVQSTKITHIGDNYFEVCITYYVERTYYDDYKVKLSVVKDGGSYRIDTIEKGKMK